MKLSNRHIIIITAVTVLFFALNFLGRTTPNIKKGQEKPDEEMASANALSEEVLLAEARTNLDSAQLSWLTELDKQKAQAEDVLQEAEVLKLISRTWFEYKHYIISGYYAKKVAELIPSGKAWSIAGTTYDIAYRQSVKPEEKKLAAQKAIEALQQAKALEPDTLQHAINEALMYVELSTVDASVMPMKGIMMMQDLDHQYPDNVVINMTLGRMSATRTRDMAKAKPRFERVISIAQKKSVPLPTLAEAYYYLIECYKAEENQNDKILGLYDEVIELTAENQQINQSFVAGKKEYLDTKQ